MATKSSLKARHGKAESSVRLEKMQETAQKVVGYAKENPLTAVGAVGASVVLTTVFWDDISKVARRGMRRFR